MPEKSAMTFLIFAWVIISWPFRMPPSSRPMMTSTMAISTSVKPWVVCRDFISSSLNCALVFARRLPKVTHLANNGLARKVQADSSNCRHDCRGFDGLLRAARAPALELLELLAQEARFVGVVDRPAFEHAPEHDAGGLELVHVLEDEDLHLPRP